MANNQLFSLIKSQRTNLPCISGGILLKLSGSAMKSVLNLLPAGLAVAAFGISLAYAQPLQPEKSADYPRKPIRLVIGYPTSGAVDLVARTIGSKLADKLGQSVIVDNRTGASGNIATAIVAKSAPDGYTVLLGTNNDSISPSLFKNLPFDLLRDLAPITLVVDFPFYLVVRPAVPAKSVRELIALAKARPGQLNFASSGEGSLPHLAGEMLKTMARVNIIHIPYRGAPDALVAILAGQVEIGFLTGEPALPFFKSGKVRALAVTGTQRAPQAPELPTLNESGLPGYELKGWHGLFAPAHTPQPIINKVHREMMTILNLKDVRDRLDAQGLDVAVPTTPSEFRAFVQSDMAKDAKIVKDTGMKINN